MQNIAEYRKLLQIIAYILHSLQIWTIICNNLQYLHIFLHVLHIWTIICNNWQYIFFDEWLPRKQREVWMEEKIETTSRWIIDAGILWAMTMCSAPWSMITSAPRGVPECWSCSHTRQYFSNILQNIVKLLLNVANCTTLQNIATYSKNNYLRCEAFAPQIPLHL